MEAGKANYIFGLLTLASVCLVKLSLFPITELSVSSGTYVE